MKKITYLLKLVILISFYSCKKEIIESEFIKNDIKIGKKDIFIATIKNFECRIYQYDTFNIFNTIVIIDSINSKEHLSNFSKVFPEKGFEKIIETNGLSFSPVNISKNYILGSKVKLSGKVYVSKERLSKDSGRSSIAGLPILITDIEYIN